MANAAMEKALKSIEMTFNPERKSVNEKVLAILRTVEMLNPENDIKWRKKAWSNVEQYDILGVNTLVSTIKSLIKSESELVGHEYIMGADTNVLQLEKSLKKLHF